jgi:DNA primase
MMDTKEIDYTAVFEILEDIFGEYKNHNDYRCQVSFDCPVCSYDIKGLDSGDGKGNLEINYKYGVYKCWVCAETHDTHGSIHKLIKKYGNPKQLKKYLLLKPEENEDSRNRVYKTVKLPKEFVSFKDASFGTKLTPTYKQAYNYIKSRNITDLMLQIYNIGYCASGVYENRIIIPSYDENKHLNYFIARSFLTKTKMKYKNPEAQKEIIIFNEHLIDWDKTIYIVEGAFDSIFIPNAIPMLGKFMSDHLFMTLYEKAKKIIIVLDPDAWNDAERLYHKINCGKLMGKVWIVKLEGNKDIADLQGKINEKDIKQLD